MKRLIVMSCTLILILAGIACKAQQNTEWTVNSSSITFKIKNAGFTVDGSLGNLKAKVFFDNTKAYNNSIEARVDTKTINTGNASRDEHLKKEDYFDAGHYPEISLKATLFTKEANGTYKGFFKLTLKNTTKDISLPFSFTEKDNKGIFKGSFTINRLDYGVGSSSIILSDQVAVTITVNVSKK